MDITITETAAARINEIFLEENDPTLKLRIYVEGGGCSGMQYGFQFAKEQAEDDFAIEKAGATILIDSMSMQYLAGSTIDFKEELMGAAFSIDNPAASSTCGCGSSFSV